jgi:hypothetical protein
MLEVIVEEHQAPSPCFSRVDAMRSIAAAKCSYSTLSGSKEAPHSSVHWKVNEVVVAGFKAAGCCFGRGPSSIMASEHVSVAAVHVKPLEEGLALLVDI